MLAASCVCSAASSTYAREESVTDAHDVRLLVPGDDGLQHLKPLTRSQFIAKLGADNLPYVLLVVRLHHRHPDARATRWLMAPAAAALGVADHAGRHGGLLFVFWVLFQSRPAWVSVAFYLLGLILGVLLISQFWTLANLIYDPRQAKRLFGFVGGGAPLGGIAGSGARRQLRRSDRHQQPAAVERGTLMLALRRSSSA